MSQEILENKPHLLKKKKIILNCPLHTCSCSLDTSSGFSRAVSGTRLGSLSHPGVVPWPTAVRGRAAASSGGGGGGEQAHAAPARGATLPAQESRWAAGPWRNLFPPLCVPSRRAGEGLRLKPRSPFLSCENVPFQRLQMIIWRRRAKSGKEVLLARQIAQHGAQALR